MNSVEWLEGAVSGFTHVRSSWWLDSDQVVSAVTQTGQQPGFGENGEPFRRVLVILAQSGGREGLGNLSRPTSLGGFLFPGVICSVGTDPQYHE
ncbi:MAG: hypothetical protein CM1200mP41_27790 [Gammaproteobacteria bacterium]|nr:MAG: hypothetical protein CM1200mP41_27790 [Gammaproteobacteria bacterium]